MISRRNFLAALPGAGMLRRADDLTHVRIDAGEIIARVNPMIFGQRAGEVITVNGPSPEATNSFEQPGQIVTVSRDHNDFGADFTFEFPAHSVTLLELSA